MDQMAPLKVRNTVQENEGVCYKLVILIMEMLFTFLSASAKNYQFDSIQMLFAQLFIGNLWKCHIYVCPLSHNLSMAVEYLELQIAAISIISY